jgi:hypothetical protein
MRGVFFCFFDGADEGEEGLFMAVKLTTKLESNRIADHQRKISHVTEMDHKTISTLSSSSRLASTMGGGHTHSHSDYPELNFSPGAKWIKSLTTDRTANFSGGHYADFNLSSVLYTHRLDDGDHIQLQRWSAPGITKPSFKEALEQDFKPAKKGESIGPSCK